MRCFIELSYDGSAYHGWQRQPESISVQQVMEETLSELIGQKTIVVGCGRTDTGVHASIFYAHFEWHGEFGARFKDYGQLAWKLNGMLPDDVGVRRIFEVGDRDHARFTAQERAYTYWVHTAKDPFLEGRSTRIYQELDLEAMNAGAKCLVQKADFAAFCKVGSLQKTTICDVRMAQWQREDVHRLRFDISADRFLRNMVRAVVGTLVDVGRGRMAPDMVEDVLRSKDRGRAGMSAAACGLYLSRIDYPFLA